MSLKKWEIKLGIHHQEMGIPCDKPVPRNMWEEVADYDANDFISTEAVFNLHKMTLWREKYWPIWLI